MNLLDKLKKSAEKSARFHGHRIKNRWNDDPYNGSSIANCAKCMGWVMVETNPAPNGIDIGGPAVALSCESMVQRIYKKFRDGMGTVMTLEAELIGIHVDDKGKRWWVYKPESGAWWGLYRLEGITNESKRYMIDPSVTYAKREDTFEGKLEPVA